MKTFRMIITIGIFALMVMCLSAFQTVEEELPMLSNPNNDPMIKLNPLTGTPISDPDLLQLPPVFVPIARYPSTYRPSSGHSQAQWVFEMYVSGEESRPILMFYGAMPTGDVSRISSAIYGLEELRRQYRGIIIAGGTSKSILDSEIYNLELWYGTNGSQRYPILPLENYQHIVNKWQKLIPPADVNNMVYAFSEEIPEGGLKANSLFFRYAKANQILWRYDESSGKYYRMQNTIEDPYSLVTDVDSSNGEQVGVENLIVMMADHLWAPNQPPEYGLFTIDFNYEESKPALIFRDGQVFTATWTSQSERFERESERMRPLRFLDSEGNNFRFKPGQTWVHIIMPGNPIYEVEAELGSEVTPGSGNWKIPYISFKPGSLEQMLREVGELRAMQIKLNEEFDGQLLDNNKTGE